MANQQQQMKQMMKQVQQMQADMAAAQDALNHQTVEGSAGGGMVKVVVSGAGAARMSSKARAWVVSPAASISGASAGSSAELHRE